MQSRTARCSCGQLGVTVTGNAERISICHCLECQKRTGSVFATQARFARHGASIEGRSSRWSRIGESGASATFHFCPECGATVFWERSELPDSIAVAVGNFAEPGFPPPTVSVYEERQHPWALAAGELPLEHQP